MIKLKEILTEAEVSRELWYHINNNISLEECVFRYGSPKYFTLMNEARLLACEENIEFEPRTKALLETDLGKFGTYKGEEVALDFPMINEEKKLTYNDFVQMVRNDMMAGAAPDEKPSDKQVASRAKSLYNDYLQGASVDDLFEAKKKKKDPPIGKPKRGGSKAYYVYVRDPKTKRIKKVSFGSGGLRAKINNPKARKAFAARHKCSTKTDRTKASYWSCRLPRYAKQLGIAASNPGGFW